MKPDRVVVFLILMLALETGPIMSNPTVVPGDGNTGPVFLDYILPDGDLWTSASFPVEVCLSDPDGIDLVYLQVAENDTWVRWPMSEHYSVNETTVVYDSPFSYADENNTSVFPFRVAIPPPGVTNNYTFRLEANDTLGNSIVSCELSRWYLDIVTTVDTTTGSGIPLPLEALAVVGVVAGCIAVTVTLYVRRRS